MMLRWYSVKDKLPVPGLAVLLKFPCNMAVGYISRAVWSVYTGDDWISDVAENEQPPTHWTYLPEGPEEES